MLESTKSVNSTKAASLDQQDKKAQASAVSLSTCYFNLCILCLSIEGMYMYYNNIITSLLIESTDSMIMLYSVIKYTYAVL